MQPPDLEHALTCEAPEHCEAPALLSMVRSQAERIRELTEAMQKVSAIRDSIIGAQAINWSEHIYPLVAALNAAGFKGAGYEIARANLGTLLDRNRVLESALTEACDVAMRAIEANEILPSTNSEAIARLRALTGGAP